MPVINVTITALAPLVFSDRRTDGQFRPSAPYVPGAVLRGALAQQLIDANGSNDLGDDFARLFTAPDNPLFRNAYPAGWTEASKDRPSSLPLPATAFSCKANSGFDGHGVYDSLIDRLCREELRVEMSYQPRCLRAEHNHKYAERIGSDDKVENFSGFRVKTHDGWKSPAVPMQLTTRVALNRRRKVADDQLLYSPLVIAEAWKAPNGKGDERIIKTVFHGSVVVNEKDRELVKESLRRLDHIGSGVARGFGLVEVDPDESQADEAKIKNDLKARVAAFNQNLEDRWRLWERLSRKGEPMHRPGQGTFFVVLLVSDAILREDGWTPTVRLEPRMLGGALAEAELLRCYANLDYRGGWNTGQRLPKDTELLASMGSVYVYYTRRSLDDESIEAMWKLEEQGVGDRRVEGFGQVRVCDEFHQVIQEAK